MKVAMSRVLFYVTASVVPFMPRSSAGQFSTPQKPYVQQSLPEYGTSFRVYSHLVVVDIVVLDKGGQPVNNLDRSQFEITENGVIQKIAAFDPPSAHQMPVGKTDHLLVQSSEDLDKIGDAPVDILVLDELNNSFGDAAYGREQMIGFLKKQPNVLPIATQLISVGESNFKVLHDYTQSREQLLKCAEAHFPRIPVKQLDSTNLLVETLGVLSQIAESTRGTRGRKNILWIGTGYPAVNVMNLSNSAEEPLEEAIHRVTRRMLDARVSLTLIDPQGVVASPKGGENQGSIDDNIEGISNVTGPYTGPIDFATFATATGGEILAGRNDVDLEIGRGVDRSRVYYTAAYIPTSPDSSTAPYRKIRVRLRDRSLRVLARDGYFLGEETPDPPPTPAQPLPAQLKFDMLSAAKTRLPYNGIGVHASRTAGGFTLSVPRNQLTWTYPAANSRYAELTVIAAIFNAPGKLLSSIEMEIKRTAQTSIDPKLPSQMSLEFPLSLPPSTARVRFVVRDTGSGAMGTADWQP
jgi:VWFA-related protein